MIDKTPLKMRATKIYSPTTAKEHLIITDQVIATEKYFTSTALKKGK
jgi:hypothetical protein